MLNIDGRELKKSCNGGIRDPPTLLLSRRGYAFGSEADPVRDLYIICGKLAQLMLYQNMV